MWSGRVPARPSISRVCQESPLPTRRMSSIRRVGEERRQILRWCRGRGPRAGSSRSAAGSPGIETQPGHAQAVPGLALQRGASSRAAAPPPAMATRRSRRRSVRSSSKPPAEQQGEVEDHEQQQHRARELAAGEEPPGHQRHAPGRPRRRPGGGRSRPGCAAAARRRTRRSTSVANCSSTTTSHSLGEEAQPVLRQQAPGAGERHMEAHQERGPSAATAATPSPARRSQRRQDFMGRTL